ncbi:hypothetical protein [Nocardia sp. NPDC004604]|uniref:hypothetical protein n=1 Tax=Nocardia sp. NPDC004604 TaxID=3157013 RepID=UPI0033A44295
MWPDRVVDDPEAVNLHVQGIAVGDHATEQVLVFQGAEEPLDHTVRTALANDQLGLIPDKRPPVDQLVLVQLTHQSRASYTEIATATGNLRQVTRFLSGEPPMPARPAIAAQRIGGRHR